MKIAICDDNKEDLSLIKNSIISSNYFSKEYNLFSFLSGSELIMQYQLNNRFDIIFIDIEMPTNDGISIANNIRKRDNEVIIIFISSHPERVFDTFNCETFNFIVKPINKLKFDDVFSRAIKKYEINNAFFVIRWKNQNTRISIKRIKYVECYKKHMIFYTFDGVYEMRTTLTETLSKLEPFGFIQTHQGYIVNMNLIKRFDGYDIILTDNTKVMISARKKSEVLIKYGEYVERWK